MRAGGHFLDSPHTFKYCRQQFVPTAFLRDSRDDYEASGRRTTLQQARDICLELTKRPPPEGLPGEDALREMAAVVAVADREILGAAAANAGALQEI